MPDLVIPLGIGSKSDNDELRLLLRSAERNVIDLGRVIVVTQAVPDWLQNALIVYCDDRLKHNKDGNMIRKVMSALSYCNMHGDFILASDDNVFCHRQKMSCCPVLFNHRGRECFMENRTWHNRMRRTFEFLDGMGLFLKHNYECHAPQLFNADMLRALVPSVDYQSGIGYCIYTLFRGLCNIDGGIEQSSCKRTYENAASEYASFDLRFAGYNDDAFLNGLREKLFAVFGEKSKYER